MCNAWNHSYSCGCAFGPGNGGGWRPSWAPRNTGIFQAQELAYAPKWGSERRTTVASFINPNATCPVCFETVVFYRSPYNGRVFFDSIGWPWPKHGCTDNGREPRRVAPDTQPRKKPQWVTEGWAPLISSRVHVSTEERTITGDMDGEFGQLILTAHALIDPHSPIFTRPIVDRPGLFDVTYLSSDIVGTRHQKAVGFIDRLRPVGTEIIGKAVAGDARALYEIGSFLLWALGDVVAAMPYLLAAAQAGEFDGVLDLAVLGLFNYPSPEAERSVNPPHFHLRRIADFDRSAFRGER